MDDFNVQNMSQVQRYRGSTYPRYHPLVGGEDINIKVFEV
jgi:hypothetical protein